MATIMDSLPLVLRKCLSGSGGGNIVSLFPLMFYFERRPERDVECKFPITFDASLTKEEKPKQNKTKERRKINIIVGFSVKSLPLILKAK